MNETDSIAAHSRLAPYYRYRAPYVDELFAGLAQKIGLNSRSRLLDVCCGGGEIAVRLAPYAGKIYAIDGSAEMMSFAPPKDNVCYAQCDVNTATFRAGEPIDHIFVGRAMHWVGIDGLSNLIDANLGAEGAVVTCTALHLKNQPWQPALERVLHKYGKQPGSEQVDVAGIPKLGALGFEVADRLQFARSARFDLRQLMLVQLSYGHGALFSNVTANPDQFMDDLETELSGYLRNGFLESVLLNWALIFRRRARQFPTS